MLHVDALSLRAPPGTTIAFGSDDIGRSWRIHNPRFDLKILFGHLVSDYDDAMPARCYTRWTIPIDGKLADVRVGNPSARLDCPEKHLSVYIRRGPSDDQSLYISGDGAAQSDLATIMSVIATFRFAPVASAG
jgi:hypothetical protein